MPEITEAWNELAPADSDNPQQGDDEMRNGIKIATRQRLRSGGHQWGTGGATTVAEDGRHLCGGDPDGDANQFIIYEDDGTTALVTIDDDATAVSDVGTTDVVTLGDGIDGSNPAVLVADEVQGKRFSTLAVPLPVATAIRVPGVLFVNRGGDSTEGGVVTILEAQLAATSGASTGTTDVEVLKYTAPAATADFSTGGTSIFTNLPTLTNTQTLGAVLSSASDFASSAFPTLNIGDAIAFEVNTLTGASDLILFLKLQRTT